MDLIDRPVAITDTESTGLDRNQHVIIEIGLVLVDQRTLEVLDEFETKIKPTPEEVARASPRALEVNGYNDEEWKGAPSLKWAMGEYARRVPGAMFAAHNACRDWGFMENAFNVTGVEDPLDYHRIDLFSVAFEKLRHSGLRNFNLHILAAHLGIPEEPKPHRAINGARCAYQIYRRLREM